MAAFAWGFVAASSLIVGGAIVLRYHVRERALGMVMAFGSGVLKVNDCTPTCAQGTYIKYPILVVLWRARPWPRHSGREYFSRLTWIFTAQRPGHTPAAQTFTLPASGQP